MRLTSAVSLVFTSFMFLFSVKPLLAANANLKIQARFTAPMVEISGLSISENRVYFASDREHDLLNIPLEGDSFRDVNVDAPDHLRVELNIPSKEQAQWEAIAVSEQEGVFLVKETGSEIFHYNSSGQLVKKYGLTQWSGRKNPDRGFEGLFLLRNGHFLIALEAEPSALIEYGPKGEAAVGLEKDARVKASEFTPPSADQLVPLASWTIDQSLGGCQYSDLAESPSGGLYILMKSCMKVVRVAELKESKSTFSPSDVYSIPSEVYHPEGLQVMPSGDFLIGTDIKEYSTNLYRLSR